MANALPEMCLEGNVAENWKLWKGRFINYVKASEVDKKDNGVKCALLLHYMGQECYRIYTTFNIPEDEQAMPLKDLIKKFDDHFQPRKNLTYERYKFFNLKQQSATLENYVTTLKEQANMCEFGDLKDGLIKCTLISGVNNNEIRERLLQKDEMSLDDCVNLCAVIEQAREQSRKMQSTGVGDVGIQYVATGTAPRRNIGYGTRAASSSRQTMAPRQRSPSAVREDNRGRYTKSGFIKDCINCGNSHPVNRCPAYGKICTNCKRRNHFARWCRSIFVKTVDDEGGSEHEINKDLDALFIGEISSKQEQLSWQIPVVINNLRFIYKIDSGAQCNVMPVSQFNTLKLSKQILKPPNVNLWSYTKNKLEVIGSCRLDCIIKRTKCSIEFFVVDSNTQPILGLPTCVKLNLIQRVDELNINTTQYEQLIQKYRALFKGIGCLREPYHIELTPNATPVVSPVRKVPLPIMDNLKNTINDLVNKNILRQVEGPSDWVNPLVIVKKPNNQLRLCMDPKYLNAAIKREHCVIPTFNEIAAKLVGAKVFSTLDAANGFYQIQLDEESSKLCTVGTPFGRYQFLRLPYGIKCAPEVFADRFSKIFKITGVVIYIDDILIYGKTKEEHDKTLNKVLEIAKANGITFNLNKCKFAQKEIKYMGHIISERGVSPNYDTIKAVREMPSPTSKESVQRILGVLNYVNKFIPNFSHDTAPLRDLLKKNSEFRWEPEHEAALIKLKEKLTCAPVLQFYDVNKEVVLSVDSSMSGTAAVLLQNNLPVAYASKAFTETQKRYAQIEKELLAICFGLEKFHDFIYGKSDVTVETDHLPLLGVFKKTLNQCPARLQRMLIQIQKYHFNLVHKPGKHLILADTLSRAFLPTNSTEEWDAELLSHTNLIASQINVTDRGLAELQLETTKDPDLSELKKIIANGWPNNNRKIKDTIKIYARYKSDLTVIDDVIYKDQRCVIPKSMRKKILEKVHYSHLGFNKCLRFAQESVFWPTMRNEIKTMVENCFICQRYAKSLTPEPLHSHEIVQKPWYKVGCDIFELENLKYVLVVDYYSKFVELEKLGYNTTSTNVITVLKSIFARQGIPNIVITDGGPQFSSAQFDEFSQEWNFEHIFSSPRYAQSNGMVERHIQTVKTMLKKILVDKKDIHLALLHYRNTPVIEGCSPFQLLTSRIARTDVPMYVEKLVPKRAKVNNYNKHLKNARAYQTQYYNTKKGAKPLCVLGAGANVLVQSTPQGLWEPGVILNKVGFRRYRVKLSGGSILVRNRRFIKKHNTTTNAPYINERNKQAGSDETPTKKVTFGPVTFLNFDNTNFNLTQDENEVNEKASEEREEGNARNISVNVPFKTTRSGRHLKPPEKLNL